MREHDDEPVYGLPERLPAGERILWQGAPSWIGLARRAFHVSGVTIYFLALFSWFAIPQLEAGVPATTALASGLKVLPMAAVALGILAGLAYFCARSAVYTITSRRVVMRFGVALPMSLNIPFGEIESADLRLYGDGSGDIPLTVGGSQRQSFAVLWPHVRPWRTVKPQPMLRCIPDAEAAAAVLKEALVAYAALHKSTIIEVPRPAPTEAGIPVRELEPAAA